MQKYLHGSDAGEALRIIQQLRDAGFVAYFAGGCVRDALLGRRPKDYDVATDATPDSVRALFGRRQTIAFGASFGVIGVLPPMNRHGQHADVPVSSPTISNADSVESDGSSEQEQESDATRMTIEPTEVATFRSDGEYSDGRRPDSVHYGDARNDALRRDFTINGLFYDPNQREIIDYVGGQADLAAGVLQTIGDPVQRFGEDRLRMLRAIRFSTTLQFRMHDGTLAAIQQHADDMCGVSGERIGAEMRRVLVSPHACEGLRQMLSSGIHRVVLPDLAGIDMDRLEHLLQFAESRSFPLALACLASVLVDSGASLPEHVLAGISRRWRLSSAELRQSEAAIKHWQTLVDAKCLSWSIVQPTLTHRDVRVILDLALAIASVDQRNTDGCDLARLALTWPTEKLNPAPLLSGGDLKALGLRPGPQFGTMLTSLRKLQLDGEITTRERAIDWLRGQ
ncbi:MAG: CCA tRNA nucleotidyltransferase [Rubripirellula sp.]|nr:[cytidine(C)-cytidine(C)-adenosine (A)]-adding enzyme [Rhodopirellula sp.]MCH1438618.1 CCA tRNA nucleotidyltransferase [Rubripirellula sp.]